MYKTVLCFEMSIFTFFASTRKFKFFGQYLARTASKSTLKINTFSYSRYYTPKCLDSGRINRKLKKIFRRVNVRAKRTTRSFRITLARALSRLCGRVDFVFKSNSAITFWSEIRFPLGYVRLLSAIFVCFVIAACARAGTTKMT